MFTDHLAFSLYTEPLRLLRTRIERFQNVPRITRGISTAIPCVRVNGSIETGSNANVTRQFAGDCQFQVLRKTIILEWMDVNCKCFIMVSFFYDGEITWKLWFWKGLSFVPRGKGDTVVEQKKAWVSWYIELSQWHDNESKNMLIHISVANSISENRIKVKYIEIT